MFLVVSILICLTLVALAVDVGHLVAVRAQMRNAADSAAVGAAYQFYKDPTGNSCDKYARTILDDNFIDGTILKDGENVTVQTAMTPNTVDSLGTVSVDITMNSNNLVSPLFYRFMDSMHVHAKAGGAGYITRPNRNVLFPIAVSLDAVPGDANNNTAANGTGGSNNGNGGSNGNGASSGSGGSGGSVGSNGNGANSFTGTSLLEAIQNDKLFTLYFNNTSMNNCAYTSFTNPTTSGNWVKDAIAQQLGVTGPQYQHVEIPSVEIGEKIYLNNGNFAQHELVDGQFGEKLLQTEVVLPVVTGTGTLNNSETGLGPYNNSKDWILAGFIGLEIISIDKSKNCLALTGRIKSMTIPGVSSTIFPPVTNNPTFTAALQKVDPKGVKLLE